MSEQVRGIQPENIYGISTANVLDIATLHLALSWRIEEHDQMAATSGFDGVEVWPTHPVIATQVLTGLVQESTKNRILSAHQSSRTSRGKDFFQGAATAAQMILLPEINQSLKHVEKLHALAGDIPVVMYRETPAEFHAKTHIAKRIIQPDPELAEEWQVKSAEDFLQKLSEQGFTGVCVDVTHMRRGHQKTGKESLFANWQEVLPVLLQNNAVTELHVAVGRIDPATVNAIGREKTLAELKDLLEGTSKTEAMQMLHFIADSGWRGQVIVEVLPTALKELMGSTGRFVSQKDLIGAYENIRESLYRVFDK